MPVPASCVSFFVFIVVLICNAAITALASLLYMIKIKKADRILKRNIDLSEGRCYCKAKFLSGRRKL